MLSGYKTYIVAAAAVIFAGVQLWAGNIDGNQFIAALLAAAATAGLRHGVSSEVKKIAPVLLAVGCLLLVAPLLSACAGQQLTIDTFAKATVQQLQTADVLAKAQTPPDLAASQCYEGMEPVVASVQQTLDQQLLGSTALTPVPGPIDFQLARDTVKTGLDSPNLLAGYLDIFNKNCGWLKADVEKDVTTIGLRLAPLGIKF